MVANATTKMIVLSLIGSEIYRLYVYACSHFVILLAVYCCRLDWDLLPMMVRLYCHLAYLSAILVWISNQLILWACTTHRLYQVMLLICHPLVF